MRAGKAANSTAGSTVLHSRVFPRPDQDQAECRTQAVIARCAVMMVAEVVGGALFGSLALPFMWSTAIGSEIRKRIAVPIICGMISSTLLTLGIVTRSHPRPN